MKNDDVSVRVGFPLGGILTIVFVVLKLTHHINWSWWWVLSPIWIPLAVAIILGLIIIGGNGR